MKKLFSLLSLLLSFAAVAVLVIKNPDKSKELAGKAKEKGKVVYLKGKEKVRKIHFK